MIFRYPDTCHTNVFEDLSLSPAEIGYFQNGMHSIHPLDTGKLMYICGIEEIEEG